MANCTSEEESCICLQDRRRRKKIQSSKRGHTKKVIKEINEKSDITSERNFSFRSSSNRQLSDCYNQYSLETCRNFDLKNKTSNCSTNLTIVSSSNRADGKYNHKTNVLKDRESILKSL